MSPGDLLLGAGLGVVAVAAVLALESLVSLLSRDRRKPEVKMRHVHGDQAKKT